MDPKPKGQDPIHKLPARAALPGRKRNSTIRKAMSDPSPVLLPKAWIGPGAWNRVGKKKK
jgi:hypothetical protein